MIMDADTSNDFISAFQDYLRQPGIVNNSILRSLINSLCLSSLTQSIPVRSDDL
jgi:hypothetical protein